MQWCSPNVAPFRNPQAAAHWLNWQEKKWDLATLNAIDTEFVQRTSLFKCFIVNLLILNVPLLSKHFLWALSQMDM